MRVLVAIPAWNEEATIARVVRDVGAEQPGSTILVVDDASSDETGKLASAAGAVLIQLPFNLGVGGAMRTAFMYADRTGHDVVVQVDADGQHDASSIQTLIEAARTSEVVVGNRFGVGDPTSISFGRMAGIRLLRQTLQLLTEQRIQDPTSGFRAHSREAIRLYCRSYPSQYLGDTVESLVIAHQAGLRITEVPVRMFPRQGGSASQGLLASILHVARILLASVRLARPRLRRRHE